MDQVGAGYSTLTEGVRHALLTAARTEGLILDPVYTGRALAGLIAAVRDGDVRPGRRTIFLHSGGLPGLFGSRDAMRWAESLTLRVKAVVEGQRAGMPLCRGWIRNRNQRTSINMSTRSFRSGGLGEDGEDAAALACDIREVVQRIGNR